MRKSCTWLALLTSMFLVSWVGCSDTSQPDYSKLGLVEISGTVTMDDQPLANVAVFFHDRENRRYSFGVTDNDGRYTLMFDSRKSGVLPGEKEIEITSTKNPMASLSDASEVSNSEETELESKADREAEETTESRQEMVPAKYNKATTLKYTVTESNQSVDFSLSSK